MIKPRQILVRFRGENFGLVLRLVTGIELDEVRPHLKAGHARARKLLVEHQDRVIRVAERLREVRQVDACEFLRLVRSAR